MKMRCLKGRASQCDVRLVTSVQERQFLKYWKKRYPRDDEQGKHLPVRQAAPARLLPQDYRCILAGSFGSAVFAQELLFWRNSGEGLEEGL